MNWDRYCFGVAFSGQGGWISEEFNIYALLNNDSVNLWDYLGLESIGGGWGSGGGLSPPAWVRVPRRKSGREYGLALLCGLYVVA